MRVRHLTDGKRYWVEAAIDLRALVGGDVERSGTGAPLAFRIWQAGKTITDKGVQFFTERSAALLMADQAARQNLYSVDVDHLSLSKTAPPESRKAVGWHRLEVRKDPNGAPELWAVNVEWTDVSRAGLEKDPPEWRYFSPAYDVDPKTGEVIGYLNTALTNNPATWGVTALASAQRGGVTMTRKEMISAFKHMAAGESAEAKAAAAVIAMLESGKIPEEPDGDEPPKKEEKTTEGAEPPPKKEEAAEEPDGDEKEEKEARAASKTELALATKVQELIVRLDARDEAEERARLMATRADLDPEVAKVLARTPIAHVRELLPKLPKASGRSQIEAARAASTAGGVTPTRGNADGEGSNPRERLDYTLDDLDERMGLRTATNQIRHDGTRMFLGVMTPAQARAKIAADEAKAKTAQGGR